MKKVLVITVSQALAFSLLLAGCASTEGGGPKVNLRETVQSDSEAVVGKLPGHTSPGEGWTYIGDLGNAAVVDWDTDDDYYFIENDKARFHIGTSTFPMDQGPYNSGNQGIGSMLPGYVMDAVPKDSLIENVDFTELVLLRDGASDHRNWWYANYKLRLPNISINEEDGSITAQGSWDADAKILAKVTYSMVRDAPVLKIEVTLENTANTNFRGDLAYIISLFYRSGSGSNVVRNGYIPGRGWFTSNVPSAENGGKALYYGWKGNYVVLGRAEGYSGETCHAIIWGTAQAPRALIPSSTYTGAWFPVDIRAKGSVTVTFLHLVYTPKFEEEAYDQAAHWAAEVNKTP